MMEARLLTNEEAAGAMMLHNEKFALLSKESGFIFYGAPTKEDCEQVLEKMTKEHPRYNEMELVQQPLNYTKWTHTLTDPQS